ncbi:MAG TPA: 1,2-phenylacetyl-CoA epoxidase subunit PaaC [Caulobacteraceae bacterium]|nr:1,2-phenylacetyl-CoA epoxidase subunit PaaC [Caulobacteraceae bacterium]
MVTRDDALFRYALRLGDDSLVLGQRLGEWCGKAPALEIDLALANLGLDLIGQATFLLGYAGEVEGKGRDADRLAFHRDVMDFSNCLLVEQPNGDFARTIARQFLFSAWRALLFGDLAASADPTLAAVAKKAVKETAYHLRFSGEWMARLGDGTPESRERLIDGLDWCWRFVDELFEADEVSEALAAARIAPAPAELRARFDATVDAVLAEAGVERPAPRRAVVGGRAGRHSEHLGHLLAEMQFLPRAYPEARW